jgi:hypothetical protein
VRTKYAVSVLFLAAGVAVAVSVTGQEEPLPTVQTRAMSLDPAIVLASEPIRTIQQPTLADAVRRNDYATFHALYLETKPPEYRALDELWTWAISDPLGAFYGRETHDKLARAYPGFAAYIDEHKIVDDRGNVFYPTSETRTFLLQKALEKQAPNVQIASNTPRTTRTATRNAQRDVAASPSSASATPRRRTTRATTVPTQTASAKAAPAKQAPTAKTEPATNAAPPVTAPATPATNAASAPATSVAPVTPVVPATTSATEVATNSAPDATGTAAGQNTVAPTPTPLVTTTPSATQPQPARTPNSGILLLVIGLIGVGLLAVILRTPRDAQPTSILQPQPQETPKKDENVEPIRRASTEEKAKPRATGSHG